MNDNKLGFKAYDPGLVCRGYQYEEGKTYKKNGHGVCVGGVTHYCVNPLDVLDYYPLVRKDGKFSEFTTVEAIDEPVTDDGRKFATSTIKIGVKLGFAGFVKACIDFVYEKTIKNMPSDKVETGYFAQIGSSGYFAQIGSSGDSAQIGSSGNSAQIGSSGNSAKIGSSGGYAKIGSSGDFAQIGSSGFSAKIGSSGFSAQIGSSGDYAQIGSSGGYARIDISGNTSVGAAIGINSIIKGAVGNWITLAEWAYDSDKQRCAPVCVKSAQIDGEIIKADTWYKLADGEFVEVADE
jgi:hypothetical protein